MKLSRKINKKRCRERLLNGILTTGLVLSMAVTSPAKAYFDDTVNHWAGDEINRWATYNVVKGYDTGSFGPDNPVSRGEMAVMLDKVMRYQVNDYKYFGDLPSNAFYTDAIQRLSAAGLMDGDPSGNVRPTDSVTRQEAAVILAGAFHLDLDGGRNYSTFADHSDIAYWAVNAVYAMHNQGLLNGRPGNMLDPEANITRAEFCKILDAAIGLYIDEAGDYPENTNSNTDSVVINTGGVVLQNTRVYDDVILSEGIANGDATISETIVGGNIIVKGGGANSIYLDAVECLGDLRINRVNAPVKVVFSGNSTFNQIDVENDATLVNESATALDDVFINSGYDVALYGNFDTITNNSNGVNLKIYGSVETLHMKQSGLVNGTTVKAGTTLTSDSLGNLVPDVDWDGSYTDLVSRVKTNVSDLSDSDATATAKITNVSTQDSNGYYTATITVSDLENCQLPSLNTDAIDVLATSTGAVITDVSISKLTMTSGAVYTVRFNPDSITDVTFSINLEDVPEEVDITSTISTNFSNVTASTHSATAEVTSMTAESNGDYTATILVSDLVGCVLPDSATAAVDVTTTADGTVLQKIISAEVTTEGTVYTVRFAPGDVKEITFTVNLADDGTTEEEEDTTPDATLNTTVSTNFSAVTSTTHSAAARVTGLVAGADGSYTATILVNDMVGCALPTTASSAVSVVATSNGAALAASVSGSVTTAGTQYAVTFTPGTVDNITFMVNFVNITTSPDPETPEDPEVPDLGVDLNASIVNNFSGVTSGTPTAVARINGLTLGTDGYYTATLLVSSMSGCELPSTASEAIDVAVTSTGTVIPSVVSSSITTSGVQYVVRFAPGTVQNVTFTVNYVGSSTTTPDPETPSPEPEGDADGTYYETVTLVAPYHNAYTLHYYNPTSKEVGEAITTIYAGDSKKTVLLREDQNYTVVPEEISGYYARVGLNSVNLADHDDYFNLNYQNNSIFGYEGLYVEVEYVELFDNTSIDWNILVNGKASTLDPKEVLSVVNTTYNPATGKYTADVELSSTLGVRGYSLTESSNIGVNTNYLSHLVTKFVVNSSFTVTVNSVEDGENLSLYVDLTYEALDRDMYKVTVVENAGASILTSAIEAGEMDTVKVTVTPKTGYTLTGLRVLNVNTNSWVDVVEGTVDGVAVYTFTMPTSDVQVTVDLDAAPFTINAPVSDPALNGAVIVRVNGKDGATSAEVGEKVTVSASAHYGYGLLDLKIITDNGQEVLLYTDTVTTEVHTFYFIMPADNVSIEATFSSAVTLVANITNGNIVNQPETLVQGKMVTLQIRANPGHTLPETVSLTQGSSTSINAVVYSDGVSTVDGYTYGSFTFTVSEGATRVTLSAVCPVAMYNVAVVDVKEPGLGHSVTIDVGTTTNVLQATAQIGTTVTLDPVPTDDRFEVSRLYYTYTNFMGDLKTVEITANSKGEYTFEMPAADVSIYAEFSRIAYEVKIADNGFISSGSYLNADAVGQENSLNDKGEVETKNRTTEYYPLVSDDLIVNGDTVTVAVHIAYGFELDTFTVKSSRSGTVIPSTFDSNTADGRTYYYTFTMPEENVTIRVDLIKNGYALSFYDYAEYFNLSGTVERSLYDTVDSNFNPYTPTTALVGENVTVKAEVQTHRFWFEVTAMTYTFGVTDTEKDVPISYEYFPAKNGNAPYYEGSFFMPAGDTEIFIEEEAIEYRLRDFVTGGTVVVDDGKGGTDRFTAEGDLVLVFSPSYPNYVLGNLTLNGVAIAYEDLVAYSLVDPDASDITITIPQVDLVTKYLSIGDRELEVVGEYIPAFPILAKEDVRISTKDNNTNRVQMVYDPIDGEEHYDGIDSYKGTGNYHIGYTIERISGLDSLVPAVTFSADQSQLEFSTNIALGYLDGVPYTGSSSHNSSDYPTWVKIDVYAPNDHDTITSTTGWQKLDSTPYISGQYNDGTGIVVPFSTTDLSDPAKTVYCFANGDTTANLTREVQISVTFDPANLKQGSNYTFMYTQDAINATGSWEDVYNKIPTGSTDLTTTNINWYCVSPQISSPSIVGNLTVATGKTFDMTGVALTASKGTVTVTGTAKIYVNSNYWTLHMWQAVNGDWDWYTNNVSATDSCIINSHNGSGSFGYQTPSAENVNNITLRYTP